MTTRKPRTINPPPIDSSPTARKPKRVEASDKPLRAQPVWVGLDVFGSVTVGPSATKADVEYAIRLAPEAGERAACLVERDPLADAVVKAARKWFDTVNRRSVELMEDVDGPLHAAIERLERRGK